MHTDISITFQGEQEVGVIQKALSVYADYLQEVHDSLPDLPRDLAYYGDRHMEYNEAAKRVRMYEKRISEVLAANA